MTTWRWVVGHEGSYEVSDDGRVRSWLKRGRWARTRGPLPEPRELSQYLDHSGYPVVQLTVDGRQKPFAVHRLLAAAFFGPRPDGFHVRHLNGIKTDCRSGNLAYGTPAENNRDTVRHGTHHEARKTACDHGHDFTVANTYISKQGHRSCRTCRARSVRAFRSRRARERTAFQQADTG